VLVAIYSAAAAGDARPRIRAVGGTVVLALLVFVAIHLFMARDQLGPSLGLFLVASLSLNAFLYAGAWFMGRWHFQRDTYERELGAHALELERSRLEREQRVVAEERVRIARELHDVVAHHVSVMGVTAGATRKVLPTDPGRAAELLRGIEAESRRAIEEMHRLLGALRSDAPAESTPARLRGLDALVETSRRAGLDTRLEVHGAPPASMPESIDLSAYRIIQESVTNTIRHANARTLRIEVRYLPTELVLVVEDDGRGPDDSRGAKGRGLVGMRERAALFGGELRAGRGLRGGFRVDARFPVPG
jgi:signal transduction histidine kinase